MIKIKYKYKPAATLEAQLQHVPSKLGHRKKSIIVIIMIVVRLSTMSAHNTTGPMTSLKKPICNKTAQAFVWQSVFCGAWAW